MIARKVNLTVVILLTALAVSAQEQTPSIAEQLVNAAMERTTHEVIYDGSYRSLAFPGGDVPDDRGVCTDVVIRIFRAIGLDLQRLVHADMTDHFADYPQIWGLTRPDSNIDHRRVPNLQTFLRRRGAELQESSVASDYLPGDLVTWSLPGNLPHIGVVVSGSSADGRRPLIVHNVGAGPELADVLFRYQITGHFRYLPATGQGTADHE